MKCLHCSKGLDQDTADFTLKIMLCKSCAVQVVRLENRLRSVLEVLLTTLDETVRFAVLSNGLPQQTATRADLLRFIADMDERCRQQIQSSKSTGPLAATADGRSDSKTQ